jgi:hypothetical protein
VSEDYDDCGIYDDPEAVAQALGEAIQNDLYDLGAYVFNDDEQMGSTDVRGFCERRGKGDRRDLFATVLSGDVRHMFSQDAPADLVYAMCVGVWEA